MFFPMLRPATWDQHLLPPYDMQSLLQWERTVSSLQPENYLTKDKTNVNVSFRKNYLH